MEGRGKRSSEGIEIPLLDPSSSSSSSGSASRFQTLGNIIVSVVGTGVLGLPFAFKTAGWLPGSIGVAVVGLASYYCMLLLIQCRDKLTSEEEQSLETATTYGDIGYKSFGKPGRYLTEILISVSQCGGSIAYLVYIGKNLSSIFRSHTLSFSSYIFLLVPLEIGLSWINTLSRLAPFSIFADICNALAMGIVLKDDIQQAISGEFSFKGRTAVTSNIGGLPFAAGMAVFCFEGFGMTLALESSMREKAKFRGLLGQAFSGITLVYVLFGFLGYMAYGDETRDIVTLNLPHDWTSIAVQMGLCVGLIFTFPIMLHPINEIVESKFTESKRVPKDHDDDNNNNIDNFSTTKLGNCIIYTSRAVLVMGLAVVASFVPGFGVFVSLVGSTVCSLISFVLPAIYHLRLMGSSSHVWEKVLDYCLLLSGLLLAAYGTYNAIVGV